MLVTLEQAAALLLSGELVAIPTETVYGLAALYREEEAVKKIFQLKNRPPENPLILHVASAEDVLPLVLRVPPNFYSLADEFWPGPLTLVLPVIEEKVPALIRAKLSTQAFRVPQHPLTLELLKQVGPVVAPSANLSGRPSSVSRDHVEADFGKEFPVLDGGACSRGVESTILVFRGEEWKLGRLGAIPAESFEPCLGYIPGKIGEEDPLICPGQKFRHYAPRARLHLVNTFEEASLIIGFSDRIYPEGAEVIPLGPSNNPVQVLSSLYEVLRSLDRHGVTDAWVDMNFSDEGLMATLSERLQKASHR